MRRKFLIKFELYDTSFCVIYDRLSLGIVKARLSFMCLGIARETWRSLWLEYLIDKSAPIFRLAFNPIWINCNLNLYSSQEILIELRRKRSRTWLCQCCKVNRERCQWQKKSIPSRFSPLTPARTWNEKLRENCGGNNAMT